MADSIDTSSPGKRSTPLHWQVRAALGLVAALPAWAVAILAGWGPGGAALAALVAVPVALALGEPMVRVVRRREELLSQRAVANGGQAVALQPSPSAAGPGTAPIPPPLEQVVLVYRPLSPIAAGQAAGIEAALRWRHPDRGLLPVDPWLPEPASELDRLCAFTIDAACRQFLRWRQELGAEAPAWLALSLPAPMLDTQTLGSLTLAALQSTGLPVECLRLVVPARLTNRVPVLPPSALGLRAHGIGLLLDDFGAGPTSLAQLGQLPVDAVRIDRSFVERASQGATQRMVIESTVRVAASLGMQIVADGIADAEQAQAMAALGCHYAQGSGCGLWRTGADMNLEPTGKPAARAPDAAAEDANVD